MCPNLVTRKTEGCLQPQLEIRLKQRSGELERERDWTRLCWKAGCREPVGRMEMGSRSKAPPVPFLPPLTTSQELETAVQPQRTEVNQQPESAWEQVCVWNFQKGCGPANTLGFALSNQRTELSHAAPRFLTYGTVRS